MPGILADNVDAASYEIANVAANAAAGYFTWFYSVSERLRRKPLASARLANQSGTAVRATPAAAVPRNLCLEILLSSIEFNSPVVWRVISC